MHPSPPLPETLTAWLESLPEPHILFDRHYRILAANAAYLRQYGQGRPVLGRTCHEVSHHSSVPCDQAGESCPLARALQSRQRERVLHLHHTRCGEDYVQIELLPLRGPGGQLQYFLEKMEPQPSASGAAAGAQGMIGRSPAFQAVRELIARVGPSQASVLLLGESGTGKELAARAGLVEAAHGGTLFLDEVGDIPLSMQVKLLRLLEGGTYRRVGQTELRRADIRLVAATHRDLRAMVREGRFRQDLYYRLSTFPIQLPALRERAQDIPLLAESLLQRVAPGRRLTLSPAALRCLVQHPFPGNVRELRNVLERAALLTDGDTLTGPAVARALSFDQGARAPEAPGGAAPGADLRSLEAAALRSALQTPGRTRRELAQALGISPRTLYRKLRALQL